jgi:hypothetical protein
LKSRMSWRMAHVLLVEDGRHGLDLLQLGRDRFDMRDPVEHAALQRGFVSRVRDRVPGTEDQLVDAGQRHKVADERHPVLSPLAEADGAHLSERADGLGETAPDELGAGDHGRRHGAETDGQNAQPAGGRLDVVLGSLHGISSLQGEAALLRTPCHVVISRRCIAAIHRQRIRCCVRAQVGLKLPARQGSGHGGQGRLTEDRSPP